MDTVRQKLDKLMVLSCDRMCEGQKWGTKDHKVLVDTIDAVKELMRRTERVI